MTPPSTPIRVDMAKLGRIEFRNRHLLLVDLLLLPMATVLAATARFEGFDWPAPYGGIIFNLPACFPPAEAGAPCLASASTAGSGASPASRNSKAFCTPPAPPPFSPAWWALGCFPQPVSPSSGCRYRCCWWMRWSPTSLVALPARLLIALAGLASERVPAAGLPQGADCRGPARWGECCSSRSRATPQLGLEIRWGSWTTIRSSSAIGCYGLPVMGTLCRCQPDHP